MCSVFSAAVAVITPATTSAAAETIATTPKGTGHATGHLGKKHLGNAPTTIIILVFPKHHHQAIMEIGVSLPAVITGTAIICGVVRLGFGTPTHRRVLFDSVSAAAPQSGHSNRSLRMSAFGSKAHMTVCIAHVRF